MPTPQARYWLVTLSSTLHPERPCLKPPVCYLKGQKEVGAGGYEHWQLLVITSRLSTRNQVKLALHPSAHVEASRSAAADDYVWKDDTAVPGTRFEDGARPVNRCNKTDWSSIVNDAKCGNFDAIPPDILLRNYSAIKRMRVDSMVPIPREDIVVHVYYGVTGSGKTRRAHEEIAGRDYFDKNPLTKWWDGYRGQKLCLIDEFAGRVDIINVLRWLDRYPCTVEVKGFSVPLEATEFWITSNLSPDDWYPDASPEHKRALRRRLTHVVHFSDPFNIYSNN